MALFSNLSIISFIGIRRWISLKSSMRSFLSSKKMKISRFLMQGSLLLSSNISSSIHKNAQKSLGWTITDIKGISHLIYTHDLFGGKY
jgi:hypothetical protein